MLLKKFERDHRNIAILIMDNSEKLKELVRQKYSEIALQDKEANQSSCCGAGGCSTEVYNIMTDDYTAMEG